MKKATKKGTMILAFVLTMPSRGSWNGRWSGEKNLYAVTRSFTGKRAEEKKHQLIGNYYYHWSDGWGANVEIKEVSPQQARSIRKQSQGFCGYEWMIESILARGKILADHQIPEQEVAV